MFHLSVHYYYYYYYYDMPLSADSADTVISNSVPCRRAAPRPSVRRSCVLAYTPAGWRPPTQLYGWPARHFPRATRLPDTDRSCKERRTQHSARRRRRDSIIYDVNPGQPARRRRRLRRPQLHAPPARRSAVVNDTHGAAATVVG